MLSHFPSHVVPWDLCLPLPFLVAKKAREISHASFVRKSSEYLGLPEMGGWIETYGINDIPYIWELKRKSQPFSWSPEVEVFNP